jgi:hypothetical protein
MVGNIRIGDKEGDEVRYGGRTLALAFVLDLAAGDRQRIREVTQPLHDAVRGPLLRMATILASGRAPPGKGFDLMAVVNTDEPSEVVLVRVKDVLVPQARLLAIQELPLHDALEFWTGWMRRIDMEAARS